MNRAQCALVIGATALLVLMMLFPPFIVHMPNGASFGLGYGFLFSPPSSGYSLRSTVHVSLLLTQWITLTAVGAAGYFLFGSVANGRANQFLARAATRAAIVAVVGGRVFRALLLILMLLISLITVVDVGQLLMGQTKVSDGKVGTVFAILVDKMLMIGCGFAFVALLRLTVNWFYRRFVGSRQAWIHSWRDL